jgi:acetyl esterase/lipase
MEINDKVVGQSVEPGDYMNCAFDGFIGINLHFPDEINDVTGLMVILHGWGGTYHQYDVYCEDWRNYYNVVTLQVNYRNSGDGSPIYDCGKYQAIDVLRAMQYVRENYKINDERIIGWGGSGGGQVILQVAKMAPNTFSLVIECAGITKPTTAQDVAQNYKNDPIGGWQAKALGDKNVYTPDEWQIRSPQYHAAFYKAKTYIFHGNADEVVDVQHAIDMYQILLDAGKEAVLKIIESGNHAFGGAVDETENTRQKATDKYANEDIMNLRTNGITDFERRSVIDLLVDSGAVYRVSYDGLVTLTKTAL